MLSTKFWFIWPSIHLVKAFQREDLYLKSLLMGDDWRQMMTIADVAFGNFS